MVMEEVARMAWIARGINPQLQPIDNWLMENIFCVNTGLTPTTGRSKLRAPGLSPPGEATGLAPEPFLPTAIGRWHTAHADERDHANHRAGVKRRCGAEGFPEYPRAGTGQQQRQPAHQVEHAECGTA